jgi:hypothetical protein
MGGRGGGIEDFHVNGAVSSYPILSNIIQLMSQEKRTCTKIINKFIHLSDNILVCSFIYPLHYKHMYSHKPEVFEPGKEIHIAHGYMGMESNKMAGLGMHGPRYTGRFHRTMGQI